MNTPKRTIEGPHRYMNELFRIINGALRLDIHKVRNYTAFLAEKLETAGDSDSAARLRRLLEETDHELRPTGLSVARALPVDSESRFPLLEPVDLKTVREPPVLLTEQQRNVVQEFLSVAKCHAQIEGSSVSSPMSLLLYGPPGCGKSRLARDVAVELGLPLYIARLDGLISSFLGSTSKNIRALFEFASRTPCVLFLDEFDAIAKLRGDTQEMGELKRVVNSFVQNLDTIAKHSIVIAATNHEELLDSAVWRRFSYRIEFSYPLPEIRVAMWEQFLNPIAFSKREIDLLVDLSDGFSGSDIHDVCTRLHRRRMVTRDQPTLHDAFLALQNLAIGEGEERRFLASLKDKKAEQLPGMLRARNVKRYSYGAISQLLGISRPTALRWLREGVSQDG
jgi:SpoVK/Ycf46/Vps4 family AAA+-type ATPase